MRNFLRLAEGLDLRAALHALALNGGLWNANTLRTTHPQSPHTEVDDIWLMFNEVRENPADTIDDVQTYPYPGWQALLPLRPLILDLMRRVDGVQLGRVIVSRLRPGGRIAPHVDEGTPATFYRRYQIALQSLPGCLFRCGDETVNMQSGEVWWINNRVEHEVINNSADDRLACIVDIRSC